MPQRSFTPNHNHLGSYTTAELPNVSGATVQSTDVQAGDTAYDTTASELKVCTDPTVGAAVWASTGGGGGGGIGDLVLWKWNETDTTQFSQVEGTATLAFQADCNPPEAHSDDQQPALILSSPGTDRSIWIVNDLVLPKRYWVLLRMRHGRGGTGIVYYYADTTHYVASCHGGSTTWVNIRANNGAPATVGATPTLDNQEYNRNGVVLEGRLPSVGVDPSLVVTMNRSPFGNDWIGPAVELGADAGVSWDVSWRSLTATSFGIMLERTGLIAGSGAIDTFISMLQVMKHPMDW
jgi:hypothetical protein